MNVKTRKFQPFKWEYIEEDGKSLIKMWALDKDGVTHMVRFRGPDASFKVKYPPREKGWSKDDLVQLATQIAEHTSRLTYHTLPYSKSKIWLFYDTYSQMDAAIKYLEQSFEFQGETLQVVVKDIISKERMFEMVLSQTRRKNGWVTMYVAHPETQISDLPRKQEWVKS